MNRYSNFIIFPEFKVSLKLCISSSNFPFVSESITSIGERIALDYDATVANGALWGENGWMVCEQHDYMNPDQGMCFKFLMAQFNEHIEFFRHFRDICPNYRMFHLDAEPSVGVMHFTYLDDLAWFKLAYW